MKYPNNPSLRDVWGRKRVREYMCVGRDVNCRGGSVSGSRHSICAIGMDGLCLIVFTTL